METLEDVLAHYGVKGMRWGVRRKRNATGELEPVQIHKNPIGQVYKTTGGKNHPTHPEAELAMRLRQQAATSGTHSLSNKELQDVTARMNLELNYARALQSRQGKSRLQKGADFVKTVLGISKNSNEALKNLNEGVARQQEFRQKVKTMKQS